MGAAGAGKSTLAGVLATGRHDDGRGRARLHTCTHAHEVRTGHTARVGDHVLGVGADGPARRLTLVDTGGLPRHGCAAAAGLCARRPEYVALVVAATASAAGALFPPPAALAALLRVLAAPLLVVVTHTDAAGPAVLVRALQARIGRIYNLYTFGVSPEYLIPYSTNVLRAYSPSCSYSSLKKTIF